MRGNRIAGDEAHPGPRSIPARAGEPGNARAGCPVSPVYPRACGGTSSASATTAAAIGLSPRVRGNRIWTALTGGSFRSIPARAGEPVGSQVKHSPSTVYPRACGGTALTTHEGTPHGGLSPRVRENRRRGDSRQERRRSIPARAGEPLAYSVAEAAEAVYPRACGGTPGSITSHRANRGLSPRVRGNQAAPPPRRM